LQFVSGSTKLLHIRGLKLLKAHAKFYFLARLECQTYESNHKDLYSNLFPDHSYFMPIFQQIKVFRYLYYKEGLLNSISLNLYLT